VTGLRAIRALRVMQAVPASAWYGRTTDDECGQRAPCARGTCAVGDACRAGVRSTCTPNESYGGAGTVGCALTIHPSRTTWTACMHRARARAVYNVG
jgi:hypothetical protein